MAGKGIPVPWEKFWERLPTISREFIVETVDNLLAEENHTKLKLSTSHLVDSLPFKDWRADKPSLLEVVDPHLFSFASGVTTKQMPSKCDFELPCVKKQSPDSFYSDKFQLLPTEFYADPKTKKVTTRSYINNLDPRLYGKVYESIEKIVEASLPHFEKVLNNLVKLDTKNNHAKITLSGRPLQIIVGIKHIHLTPNTWPTYPGSQWHTEGLRNERIVASGIYYYDVSNISESQLAFRVQTDSTNDPKNDRIDVGHVTAQTNRLVVFPNIYEHSVKPFQLENNAQSGYRKFVTLFLVDPTTKIISTADVSPQQKSWYPIGGIHSNKLFPSTGTKAFTTSGTMSLEAAEQYRNKASAERGVKLNIKTSTSSTTTSKYQQTTLKRPSKRSRRRSRSSSFGRKKD